jgi:hypothetical protein
MKNFPTNTVCLESYNRKKKSEPTRGSRGYNKFYLKGKADKPALIHNSIQSGSIESSKSCPIKVARP